MKCSWFKPASVLAVALTFSLSACIVEGDDAEEVVWGDDYELEQVEVELESSLGGGERVGDDEALDAGVDVDAESDHAPFDLGRDFQREMEPDPEPWKVDPKD